MGRGGLTPPAFLPSPLPLDSSSFDPILSCGKYEMNGVKSQPGRMKGLIPPRVRARWQRGLRGTRLAFVGRLTL